MITVDPKKCPQDHRCPLISICPKNAISQEGYDLPKVDHEKCVECNLCVAKCPYGAFSLK